MMIPRLQRLRVGAAMAPLVAALALGLGCATQPPPAASSESAAGPNSGAVTDPRLVPPPFASPYAPPPPPLTTPEAREDTRTRARRSIVDAVWRTVRDRHYDPNLGGVDWVAVRARYEPLALAAPDDATFYRTLNQMVGELGQSHLQVTGPGAGDDSDGAAEAGADGEAAPPASASTPTASAPPTTTTTTTTTGPPGPAAPGPPARGLDAPVAVSGIGDPGLTVRSIEGRPVVTAVRAGSSAARQGIRPGFVVVQIGGRSMAALGESPRPLRPVEERFRLRRTALRRLQGPIGSRVTVRVLDADDRPAEVVLERDRPPGPVRQIGHLPPLYPETHATITDGVGIVAFNLFLLDPVLDDVKRAFDRFRAARVKGVILDLRGNPGGIGAMAIPVAAELVGAPTTLGTVHFRTFAQTFTARPSMGRTPYLGPVVVLTDEGSASTSEILAGGLQEAGRARVIGETTLGAVLPSLIEALPGGAVIQVVVADFQTPKGVLLEGRGVQPDQRVIETRAAFRAGRDPVMEAALDAIRGRSARAQHADPDKRPVRAPSPSVGSSSR
jgi:carboxyl-terminal processing protease